MKNWYVSATLILFASVSSATETEKTCPLDPLAWGSLIAEENQHALFADLMNKTLNLEGIEAACVELIDGKFVVTLRENKELGLPKITALELEARHLGPKPTVRGELTQTCGVRFYDFFYLIEACTPSLSEEMNALIDRYEIQVQKLIKAATKFKETNEGSQEWAALYLKGLIVKP